jgi:hypothetical protein
MVTAMIHNAPLMFLASLMTLTAGLAMVLGHNLWSGGALPVVVTLTGWVTLIKGLLLLFLSPEAYAGLFLGGLHYEQLFYLYSAISLLLGIYLAYAGMTQRAK